MSTCRILLTGAAGKVARYVAPRLAEQGVMVFATDLKEAPGSFRGHKNIHYFQADLTDRQAVEATVEQAKPHVVLHTAAIVAPISYANTELACKVNVDATRYLLEAIQEKELESHFVFCSSYTVHGPCAPEGERWSSDTPLNPADDYGHQKVLCEGMVQQRARTWTILRIGAVFDADALFPAHPTFKPFGFMVPLLQREHGVDVQDVASALVRAAEVLPDNRILMIGGDDSWCKVAEDIRRDFLEAAGFPVETKAYRPSSAVTSDQGWYYENWMDTREAQTLLGFQNHSYEDFVGRIRKKLWLLRWVSPVLRVLNLVRPAKDSPYLGTPSIKPGETQWEDIKAVFGLTDEALNVSKRY